MDNFEISNKNDIYKGDFDAMVSFRGLETFTKSQVAGFIKDMDSIIKKGETNELGTGEKEQVDMCKAELDSLTVWNVVGNDNLKTVMFTRESQVDIEKGIYKDTHLNRKMGRVGKEWGGKKTQPDFKPKKNHIKTNFRIDSIDKIKSSLETEMKNNNLPIDITTFKMSPTKESFSVDYKLRSLGNKIEKLEGTIAKESDGLFVELDIK
jgi:hypothetical protein